MRSRVPPRVARPQPTICPPHQTSRTTFRVRFAETDLMGIVHHASYLIYFEAGRVDWLHKRGISYDEWAREGIHLPVVDAALRYRKAARFDDWLDVDTTCAQVTRVTIRFEYRVLRREELLCEGHTLLACVGADLLPRRISPLVAEILASAEVSREQWT